MEDNLPRYGYGAAAEPLMADPGAILDRIRAQWPVVHCLTNVVTVGRVADALAALGALPVMAAAPEEAADVAAGAQAVVLNLGTPTVERWQAAALAGRRARECGVPVVVDPVGCGATPWRTDEARRLVRGVAPDVVRGNAPEIAALAALAAPPGVVLRGVSASGGSGAQIGALTTLAQDAARALGGTVVLTGHADVLASQQGYRIWTERVPALAGLIGAGDVLTAVIAACRAVEADGRDAAWGGLAIFTAAARAAGARCAGPGTFWPALVDALQAVTSAEVAP